MAESATEVRELTQAINDNNTHLRVHAQSLDINARTMVDCTTRLGEQLTNVHIEGGQEEVKSIFPSNSHIPIFDGNPHFFESWIKEVEKFSFLHRSDERKKQLIAYQFSTGIVSDYIKRYLDSETDHNWTALKQNLSNRFSPMLDKPKAFELLVNIRQGKDEDVQFYAERLLGLAEKAYPDQNDHVKPIIESQLLTLFLSGLSNVDVRAQVERSQPRNFEEAYAVALREQTIIYRCAVRKSDRPDRLERRPRPEPMEVGHMRNRSYLYCSICRKKGHDNKSHRDGRPDEYKKRELICWQCNEKGHSARNCQAKKSNLN